MTLILPPLLYALPHAPNLLLMGWIVGGLIDLTTGMEKPDE